MQWLIYSISAGTGVMVPYLGEFYSKERRDLAISIVSIILGVICVLLPFLASLVINTDFTLEINFMKMIFKPWRLFMFISGVPNLITGVSLYFLPESPKFLHSVRCVESAVYVFKNAGSNEENNLSYFYKLQRETNTRSIWKQSANLFSRKYLRLTLTIWTIHIAAFSLGGMGSWYPEIVDSVTSYINYNETGSATICEMFGKRLRPETLNDVCVEKFEISTYSFVIFSEVLFVIVMVSFSVAVKWISKTILLGKIFYNRKFLNSLFAGLTFFLTFISILLTTFLRNPHVSLYLFTSFVWSRALVMILAAIIVESYPTNMRSLATCVANIVARLSYIAASNYIAVLLDYHCELSFVISAFWTVLGGICAFYIPNSKRS